MNLESSGILISLRPLGETDSVARVFTSEYGVLCGMMRGAQRARKNRPLVGQVGTASWNARLDSQLGVFHWDAEKNLAATLILSRDALMFMNSAFALISTLLPEREQYKNLYQKTVVLLQELSGNNAHDAYLDWEIMLLRELGYALNLGTCSGCGTHDDLEFLSPRTGRAVCKNCGAPYATKLYRLPLTLDVTGRFIARVCVSQGIELPLGRKVLNQL